MSGAPPGLFNMAGVISPVDDKNPTSTNRSPYLLQPANFVKIFGFTKERLIILQGLFKYRSELYEVGITSGFQWLNGSFVTDIENLEQRPPGDIDVVTFFYLPENETQQSFLPKTKNLLNTKFTKPEFKVDAYPVVLGEKITPALIDRISYWYSMWSHRKSDNMWKGFIKLELNPSEDIQAVQILNNLREDM